VCFVSLVVAKIDDCDGTALSTVYTDRCHMRQKVALNVLPNARVLLNVLLTRGVMHASLV
jgi:hypothetical protein